MISNAKKFYKLYCPIYKEIKKDQQSAGYFRSPSYVGNIHFYRPITTSI